MMEEVRQLVQEEGREARNLVAFHVAVDTPSRVSRKPPRAVPPPRRAPPRATRLRSASAGRDKRSELRARYWALLFGDLQRSVGEIYNTVEAHENLNECQEVILVLENYTRDFKALGEWFRLKWEYDNTPPPQRPQSLAWEIRKTDFVRPESRRTHSVKSSPSVSGKNSPCFSGHNTPSGKNSPNLTGKASPGSGKISPRISACHSSTSPKASVEFFTNKIVVNKMTAKPEVKPAKETTRLSDIKEKDFKETDEKILLETNQDDPKIDVTDSEEPQKETNAQEESKELVTAEIGNAKELPNVCPNPVIKKSPKSKLNSVNLKKSKSDVSIYPKNTTSPSPAPVKEDSLIIQMVHYEAKLENFLNEHNEFILCNRNINDDKESLSTESPTKSEENFADVSYESSPKSSADKSEESSEPITDELSRKAEINAINDMTVISIKLDRNGSNGDVSEGADSISIDNIAVESNIELGMPIEPSQVTNMRNSIVENGLADANIKVQAIFDKNSNDLSIINADKGTKIIKENGLIHDDDNLDAPKEGIKFKEDIVQNGIITKENKILTDSKGLSKDNKQLKKSPIEMKEEKKEEVKKESDLKRAELKPNVETKTVVKPAYSQAAAKPKTTPVSKIENKTPTRTALVRSSTVVEMRPNTAPKAQRQFQKRNQASKCSYPFNLTTSRISVFDTPSNATGKAMFPKRTTNRNIQMASGDAKSVPNKAEPKRSQRPNSLKINGKENKLEKNQSLEKIKDNDEYSSCDTVVDSQIQSSDSVQTLSSENLQLSGIEDSNKTIESMDLHRNNNDNEGWLTVKSRRLSRESKKHSKSLWANRFNQPSATTSLPTLNILESPKEATDVIGESSIPAIADRAKSEQPESVRRQKKILVDGPNVRIDIIYSDSSIKVTEEKETSVKVELPMTKAKSKIKDPAIIRQKSDVTGLKTKSSTNKVLTKKEEKILDPANDDEQSDLTKNRLHSSLESLPTGLARSQESTEETFDFDKWKAEFKSTFKYLDDDDQIPDHNEILKTADPSEMSEIAAMTSEIEENEKKIGWALDLQSEFDQQKLCEEEDLLNRQILELQQVSDIDLDTETDDTETDAEILCEDSVVPPPCCSENTLGPLAASLEDQYETALAGMSWAERVDTLVVLEALVARDPGRAQQLHAKLSQGIKRRGSLQDALRRLQAKQARAERQRNEYQTERAKRIHQLLARVEEVKVAKNQLIEEKRLRMEIRLQKAAENRDQYLKDKVKKAHDEEEKLREIAFITQLQAQHRRHDFLAQCRDHTARLKALRRDRLTKLEEKAAREAAVGARRMALEEARRNRVESLMQRRRLRDERVKDMKEMRRQEKDDAAREKAEGVKSRLSALAAAAEQEADALRSRIRTKQDASQQRLEMHLQAVREKATGPRQPTTSESADQPTSEEAEAERLEKERREREKLKIIKRKARKMKLRLLSSGNENPVYEEPYEPYPNPIASKMHKVIQQIAHSITPLCKETATSRAGCPDNRKNARHDSNGSEATDISLASRDNSADKKEGKEGKKRRRREREREMEREMEREVVEQHSARHPEALTIERQLNELYRVMEKFDMYSPEKVTVQKMQGLKVIGQLLALAAEREDLASYFTTKSLRTAVGLVARAACSCSALGVFVLSTNAVVHLATLLLATLDKDLQSDPKEMDLAKQLTDCLSVALDSVLCSTRLQEEKCRPRKDMELLTTLRNRAHMIISYLCLSGFIAKAERAGEARDVIQTLLTLCADLCHPSEADVGSERSSAKQSLRCALGTSLCGARAEFCVLFDRGADLGHCGTFVRAARTAHLLRTLAEMDYVIVQEAFGEGGWPLEFRAAVARLLSQHAPNDKEAPRTTPLRLSNQRLDQTLSETMVLDLIVLVGFVVVNNPALQETICDGWSVIKTLCTLPANWLVSTSHNNALLPTLVALAERPATAAAIAAEFSVEMMTEFMESAEAQKIKLVQVIKQGRNKKPKK